ncbi:uncharacterized protein LOC141651886 [Silene latifolia]|uniref:uncharacterized protein LOC141651886 n=1 Tax=Silene latifolia TaxID=37657 RepID=UPI003D781C34
MVYVSWDKCCSSKAEGGLGIKSAKTWNKALLGKYVWWIASKKDHLWIKWVSSVYLKDCYWANYSSLNDCSWSWKKIAHIMKNFRPAYVNDLWLGNSSAYTTKEGYKWLRVPLPNVAVLGRLLTKDRLAHMGGSQDLTWFLCNSSNEDHGHLFFACHFSNRCVLLLQHKLNIYFDPRELAE